MPGFDKLSRKTVVTWNAMIIGYALHGQGEDALSLFHQMIREDLKPDSITFTGILSACKIHCNVELGECAAKHLFELEPDNAGNYVLLSNIYAQADRWDDIRSLKEVMKEMGLKKRSGWSWICVRNRVHVFSMEDGSHPQMAEIYANLKSMQTCTTWWARWRQQVMYLLQTVCWRMWRKRKMKTFSAFTVRSWLLLLGLSTHALAHLYGLSKIFGFVVTTILPPSSSLRLLGEKFLSGIAIGFITSKMDCILVMIIGDSKYRETRNKPMLYDKKLILVLCLVKASNAIPKIDG